MSLQKCSLCSEMEDPRFGCVLRGRRYPLCDGCGGPENEEQLKALVALLSALPEAKPSPIATTDDERARELVAYLGMGCSFQDAADRVKRWLSEVRAETIEKCARHIDGGAPADYQRWIHAAEIRRLAIMRHEHGCPTSLDPPGGCMCSLHSLTGGVDKP